jgi:hypothetical protein
MKITQKQLKDLVKEEFGPKNKKQKSMLLEAPSPENEVFSDIIDHHSMVFKSKMSSIVGEIYKELEQQGLDRDTERQMLLDAARELNELRAENPLANVILEQLRFLEGPSVLLKEVGGATEAFGE